MPSPRSLAPILLACAVVLATVTSRAESAFEFAYPSQFGRVPAATYDDEGNRIGAADLLIERQDDGNVRIFTLSGSQQGARTVASAIFAPSTVKGDRSVCSSSITWLGSARAPGRTARRP